MPFNKNQFAASSSCSQLSGDSESYDSSLTVAHEIDWSMLDQRADVTDIQIDKAIYSLF